MNLKIKCWLGALLFCSLQSVSAQTILFKIDIPSGFCKIDRSIEKDAFFDEYIKKIAGHSLKIHTAALPCDDLGAYRASPLHLPKKFIAWAQVGVDGSFTRFLLGKSMYSAMITTFSPKRSLEKIEKRTSSKISTYGGRVENLQADILGEQNGTVFIGGTAQVLQEAGTQVLELSAATTLIEKYPWAVMYGSTDANKVSKADLKSWLNAIDKR